MSQVSKEAEVFPSHLFYYFDSKEELLKAAFIDQSNSICEALSRIDHLSDVQDKIRFVGDLFFQTNSVVNQSSSGFLYEAIGMSVKDPDLAEEKYRLDCSIRSSLRQLFDNSELSESAKDENAEEAYVLLVGFKLSAFFDSLHDMNYGKKKFEKSLLRLINANTTPGLTKQSPNTALAVE